MKLIVTSSIKKLELEAVEAIFSLEILKVAAKKCLEGLGDTIKSSTKIPGTLLKKVYLTSSGGAGRVVFLLQVNKQASVLVMVRPKNDKQIGANMTVQNSKFKKVLEKNLAAILEDLQKSQYIEYPLDL